MTKETESCDLIERVAVTIRRWRLLREVRCVLVGVSGGADSVALLAVLRELARRSDVVGQSGGAWRVAVAHLNHGIRPEAAGDARFVRELCESWRVECVVGDADVPTEAARTGESIESAARRVRYEFLTGAAERVGAQAVAVAHHADDNAETVLHRALRGTGLAGLAGIPVERALGPVRLIRPMLHCRRAEIERFLAAAGLSWREDETNRHLDHRRNFLRHELLPRIRERVNPRASDALLRLAEQAQTASEFLRTEAQRVLDEAAVRGAGVPPATHAGKMPAPWPEALSASVLATAHPAVRSEAIRLLFEHAGLPARDLDAATVARACELLCDPAVNAVNLPRNWRLRRRRDVVRLVPPEGGDAGMR